MGLVSYLDIRVMSPLVASGCKSASAAQQSPWHRPPGRPRRLCKDLKYFSFFTESSDRRRRPLVERIVFDAVLFCCGDILRKGVELAFQRSAMLGEDIERRQSRNTEAYQIHRGGNRSHRT